MVQMTGCAKVPKEDKMFLTHSLNLALRGSHGSEPIPLPCGGHTGSCTLYKENPYELSGRDDSRWKELVGAGGWGGGGVCLAALLSVRCPKWNAAQCVVCVCVHQSVPKDHHTGSRKRNPSKVHTPTHTDTHTNLLTLALKEYSRITKLLCLYM